MVEAIHKRLQGVPALRPKGKHVVDVPKPSRRSEGTLKHVLVFEVGNDDSCLPGPGASRGDSSSLTEELAIELQHVPEHKLRQVQVKDKFRVCVKRPTDGLDGEAMGLGLTEKTVAVHQCLLILP